MLNNFFKYQSIGNDFILFDCYHKDLESLNQIISSKNWKGFVSQICKRNFGIGADGVLIVKKDNQNTPELLIYNADGSKAEMCVNGLRCAAKHLREYHDLDRKLEIKVSNNKVNCQINKNNINVAITEAQYRGTKEINVHEKSFIGHMVKLPNQHFIIPQKTTIDWLNKNGKLIESNKKFKGKTNIEFVWPQNQNNIYNVLVYERGVGVTLSCGSGAAAICWTLFKTQKIKINQKISLSFSGGKTICWLDKNKNIFVQATSKLIFKGQLEIDN